MMAPFTGQVNTRAAGFWLISGAAVSWGCWEGLTDGAADGAALGGVLTLGDAEGLALGAALAVIWGICVLPATASAGSSPVLRIERMRK